MIFPRRLLFLLCFVSWTTRNDALASLRSLEEPFFALYEGGIAAPKNRMKGKGRKLSTSDRRQMKKRSGKAGKVRGPKTKNARASSELKPVSERKGDDDYLSSLLKVGQFRFSDSQPKTSNTSYGQFRARNIDSHCETNSDMLDCLSFSKIQFPDEYTLPRGIFPLTKNNFPLQADVASILKKESFCPSVIDASDVDFNVNIETVIERIGGRPSFPSCDVNNTFWNELEEILDMQKVWKKDKNAPGCSVLGLPDLWKNFTLEDVTEAVHDEYPGEQQARLIGSFLKQGIKTDSEIIPQRSKKQFLRGPVLLAELNTWAVSLVGPHSFQVKWHIGRPRPEEVLWNILRKIETGHTSCFPGRIVEKVKSFGFDTRNNTQTDFTSYPEGSPEHPSWPAMHSAASSLSLWIAVVCDLTEEQLAQAKKTDYAVAYARTVAGVHYFSDNTSGLNLGTEVIANVLPVYLHSRFGSDVETVKAKIKRIRSDWNTYKDKPGCS